MFLPGTFVCACRNLDFNLANTLVKREGGKEVGGMEGGRKEGGGREEGGREGGREGKGRKEGGNGYKSHKMYTP